MKLEDYCLRRSRAVAADATLSFLASGDYRYSIRIFTTESTENMVHPEDSNLRPLGS